MSDQIIAIILILVGFCFLIWINSRQIFGFYYACKYEEVYEADKFLDEDTGHVLPRSSRIIPDPETKEILWFIKYYSKMWLGDKWTKPICGCPVCMSSLHSFWVWIPIYWTIQFTMQMLFVHAVYIMVLAGVNYLITSLKSLEL